MKLMPLLIALVVTINNCPAQETTTNFVTKLGLNKVSTPPGKQIIFNSDLRSLLSSYEGFVITFQMDDRAGEDMTDQTTPTTPGLELKIGETSFLKFERTTNSDNTRSWQVTRKFNDGELIRNISYRIYDQMPANGKVSIMLTKYFIGIACDDGEANWYFSPLLFGLDSNAGRVAPYFPRSNMDIFLKTTGMPNGKIDLTHPYATGLTLWGISSSQGLIVELGRTEARSKVVNARLAPAPQIVTDTEDTESKEPGSYGVYPNPVTNRVLNVSGGFKTGEVIEYVVFDLAGRKIADERLTAPGSEVTIPLPDEVHQGMFLLQVHSNSTGKRKQLFYVK